MTVETLYLDSPAIVKLIQPEPETRAFVGRLSGEPEAISSALARVEVLRAVKRIQSNDGLRERATEVLERLTLIRIDDSILGRAAELDASTLRSLDAIHLATALGVGAELTALVTYDAMLGEAAARAGVPTVTPTDGG